MGTLAVFLLFFLVLFAAIFAAVFWVQYSRLPIVQERRRLIAAVRPYRRFVADTQRSYRRLIWVRSSREGGGSPALTEDMARLRTTYGYARAWGEALREYVGPYQAYHFGWFVWERIRMRDELPEPEPAPPPPMDIFSAAEAWMQAHPLDVETWTARLELLPSLSPLGRIQSLWMRIRRILRRLAGMWRARGASDSAAANLRPGTDAPAAAGGGRAIEERLARWFADALGKLRRVRNLSEKAHRPGAEDALEIDVSELLGRVQDSCAQLRDAPSEDAALEPWRVLCTRRRILENYIATHSFHGDDLSGAWTALEDTLADCPHAPSPR